MVKAVSLDEFVRAFSEWFGEQCSPETWLFADLDLDDDELGWAFLEIEKSGFQIPVDYEIDPYKFLPPVEMWPGKRLDIDLKLRELYAMSRFRGDQ